MKESIKAWYRAQGTDIDAIARHNADIDGYGTSRVDQGSSIRGRKGNPGSKAFRGMLEAREAYLKELNGK